MKLQHMLRSRRAPLSLHLAAILYYHPGVYIRSFAEQFSLPPPLRDHQRSQPGPRQKKEGMPCLNAFDCDGGMIVAGPLAAEVSQAAD